MYTVVIHRYFENEESWFIDVDLVKDGKVFAKVKNTGTGGSNSYHQVLDGPSGSKWRDAMSAFDEEADKWAKENSEYPDFEPDDQYVDHLIMEKLKEMAGI